MVLRNNFYVTGKVGGGVDEGGIGGNEDNRRGLNGGGSRGMTTGRGARSRGGCHIRGEEI